MMAMEMKTTVTQRVLGLCEVITELRHSEDETEAAITSLNELLYSNPQNRALLCRAVFTRGGVPALLGILRSCQSLSLQAKAAGCLSLLVHNNREGASQLASCDDIAAILFPLLCPQRDYSLLSDEGRPQSVPPLSWQKQRLPVYERVLSLLRKLTFHCPRLQHSVAQQGGIRLLIEFSSSADFIRQCSSFSDAARERLAAIALGRKLICHAVSMPEGLRGDVMQAFPVLSASSLDLAAQYPAYIVDLMFEEGKWVADLLVASGEVWPSHVSFPKGVEPVWTCVMVTCVEDGGNVWCQFCSDKPKPKIDAMATFLRELAPPSSEHTVSPAVGELYLAYFDPTHCHTPSCLTTPVWSRARLLGVESGGRLSVLSTDYGVTATVLPSHLLPIPPQCKGVPPLAIPCRLLGVAPIPVCTVVQENAAGILRNLAFEQSAFRKEIVAFGGVEALLKLSLSSDVGVVEQATAVLLNMAASEELRQVMGEKGAVDTLLALALQHPPHPSLLLLSLQALHTLTTHCPQNRQRLLQLQAREKLSAMLDREELGKEEREMATNLLRMLAPPHGGRGHCQAGVEGRGVKGDVSYTQRRQSGSSPGRERQRDGQRDTGERRRAKRDAVYRCLGDVEPRDPSDDVMVLSGGGECECEEGGGVSGAVATNQTYFFNSLLPYKEDETHAFRQVDSVHNISRGMLQRCICAMVNTGKTCTIFIGVSKECRVHGVQVGRKERDQLGVAIDRIIHSFNPAIKHHRYKVLFVPVISQPGGLPAPLNSHVVQLEILGGGTREIHTTTSWRGGERVELCYYRYGNTNVQLSPQELRNMLALQESSRHGNEICSLMQNIRTLKFTLDQFQAPPTK